MMTLSEAEARVTIIKAMVHPLRLLVIEFLSGGEKAFSALFNLFQLHKSTIFGHLLVLVACSLRSYGSRDYSFAGDRIGNDLSAYNKI
jgi:DNA-binding transcriptional ArsR family regulator